MEPQIPGEAILIEYIVKHLKAKGMFDEFRQECLADMDTKSSYQNLTQRIDGYTIKFLANETFHPDMNKNELRNKLRRSIEESGILNLGADHVVEQVITAKIRQVFFPRITEVVHQYIKEQNEMSSNFPEASASEKAFGDTFGSKTKPPISDPIADILSFSYSKSKPTTSTHAKADNMHLKHADVLKLDKKKEKPTPITEKNSLEIPTKVVTTAAVTETKTFEKEKQITENNPEVCQEVPKHVLKEEFKPEKIKTEDVKTQSSDTVTPVEENKANVSTPVKPLILQKKDLDKNKQKLKTTSTQKTGGSSSEIKKPKKESSDDKPSDKIAKTKCVKSLKELSSPKKNINSIKSVFKEEKGGESSKLKSFDTNNSKTESSVKKFLKSSSIIKKDNSKHKRHSEKTDKSKISKSSDKNEQNIHYDSSNSEKAVKNIHYSSSQDSSQSSDQEKSSFSSSNIERQKHFSKHVQKSEEHSEKGSKTVFDKSKLNDADESLKKLSIEKSSKHEHSKGDTTTIEVAKLSSCSNSFGSTSSVSSSPTTSKDNLSNSDEVSENSVKEKKKKLANEKDFCQNPSRTLPPPSPPPPSSSSLLASSAEIQTFYDTQSSSDDSEVSSNEGKSEESLIDSDLEPNSSTIKTLNESVLTPSTYNLNDFYDIFLYSSSSSEFEGFENSPEKMPYPSTFQDVHSSELSVSSVHTSDLSSYDDTLSDEEFSFLDESNSIGKKKLTLREAQDIFQNKTPTLFEERQNTPAENSQDTDAISLNEKCIENSPSVLYDEKPPSSEPIRLLRRERKLNPRYASSEYTSIFNSKKETFITKRNSPSTQNNNACSSSSTETTCERKVSLEKEKLPKKSLVKSKKKTMLEDQKINNLYNSESNDETDISKISDITCSNEMNSFLKKDIFQENNKGTGNEHLKINLKLHLKNNSKLNRSSNSVKYKISVKDEASPVKRICNENSELIPNENKPFNSEKKDMIEDKLCADGSLKRLGLSVGIKNDLFCKQRANNNGDVLNQKDIFSNNPHGKTIINAEKKTSESDTSKELNDL